jgi:hypothetical protein
MIKRSALIALMLASAVQTRNIHVHGPNHIAHVSTSVKSTSTEVKVQGEVIPDVSNEDVCSFYQDDSFYVLKFIIARGFDYN